MEEEAETPRLEDYAKFGQSIWYDYLRRSFITSGGLQTLIDEGLRGVTANPSIFEKAIVGSTDYDEDIRRLVKQGMTTQEILETLMLEDVAQAADLLRPVYDRLDGADGYVSIEVSPLLANDTDGTIAEARRFYNALKRPNVMIKVPATPAGFPAIERLTGEGINVNVTLIFSQKQYKAAAEAYIAGIEKLAEKGGDLKRVASVASFFVSRVDTAVDRALERIGEKNLQGKIAIANAKVAYEEFREVFWTPRWDLLRVKGARVQRPLWASTGTKNPSYPDTLYVDALVGPDTVNTVPPATLTAALDHGKVASVLEGDLEEARSNLRRLSELGIILEAITTQLEEEGVAAFAKSLDALLVSIKTKHDLLLSEWRHASANLTGYQALVAKATANVDENRIIHRIWAHDYTVWKPEPTEISNRLGWLHTAEIMRENVHRLKQLLEDVRSAGYTDALVLGMGGSSLAPEVFAKTFGGKPGFLKLSVLDSTDPAAVLEHSRRLDPAKTLFVVSTKSGGTVETFSFFKYFYNRTLEVVGQERTGEHFVAITDPGSELDKTADRYRFRAKFLNDPNIGGRYSALSFFGLVPAALVGVDVPRLLDEAMTVTCACDACVEAAENPGAWLGGILGELEKAGRNKVTVVASLAIASFGDWVEQLIAESTGKEGKGILPVVGERLGTPDAYANDRVFVSLQLGNDQTFNAILDTLQDAGHPVIRFYLKDVYELGRQFFVWEMAIAVAGYFMGINPFDQPDVESAKVLARKMVTEYSAKGSLPSEKPALSNKGITVYGNVTGNTPSEALVNFLKRAGSGAYVALQAYVQPTPDMDAALLDLRTLLRARFKLATTVGYGPRFLHSTGQLHKGDAGRGLFVQFVSQELEDIGIPDDPGSSRASLSFGILRTAEALGDRQALVSRGREVIAFDLGSEVLSGVKSLSETIAVRDNLEKLEVAR